MSKCPNCGEIYSRINGEEVLSYNNGELTVRDVPIKKCKCDDYIDLYHGVLIDLFKAELNRFEVCGEISVSLNELIEKYRDKSVEEILKEKQRIFKEIDSLKLKLEISSDLELMCKAVNLLYELNTSSKNEELDEQITWMKGKLNLDSNEKLFSKALTFLHWGIELEDTGYELKAIRDLGIIEGKDQIIFNIIP